MNYSDSSKIDSRGQQNSVVTQKFGGWKRKGMEIDGRRRLVLSDKRRSDKSLARQSLRGVGSVDGSQQSAKTGAMGDKNRNGWGEDACATPNIMTSDRRHRRPNEQGPNLSSDGN